MFKKKKREKRKKQAKKYQLKINNKKRWIKIDVCLGWGRSIQRMKLNIIIINLIFF